MFAEPKLDHIVNKIIISVKYLIFKGKNTESAVTLRRLILFLKSESRVEKTIATNNNQHNMFRGMWSPMSQFQSNGEKGTIRWLQSHDYISDKYCPFSSL